MNKRLKRNLKATKNNKATSEHSFRPKKATRITTRTPGKNSRTSGCSYSKNPQMRKSQSNYSKRYKNSNPKSKISKVNTVSQNPFLTASKRLTVRGNSQKKSEKA